MSGAAGTRVIEVTPSAHLAGGNLATTVPVGEHQRDAANIVEGWRRAAIGTPFILVLVMV